MTSSPWGIECGSDCSETYEDGLVVTLTATPEPGSAFTGWGGACSGTAATCSVSMSAARSVTAGFTQVPGFYAVTPCRFLDTRDASLGGTSALAAGSTRTVLVAGKCGVLQTAKAVSINVTVTQPDAPGYLTLSPAGMAPPTVSVINFSSGQTRANNTVVPLGEAGDMDVFAGLGTGSST